MRDEMIEEMREDMRREKSNLITRIEMSCSNTNSNNKLNDIAGRFEGSSIRRTEGPY